MTAATVPPPYFNSDKDSLAHDSVLRRWQAILAGAIDDAHKTVAELDESEQEKIEEGKEIIKALVAFKYDMAHDRSLKPLPEDGTGEDVKLYNSDLAAIGQITWHSAPWLYSECYLYRYLQTLFERSNHWQGYDLFRKQKDETFRKSAAAVGELATRYHGLSEQLKNDGANEEALRLLFREFVDISLWGNATDLSLLVSVSLEQLQTLQGSDARKKNEKNILVNHVDDAWEIVCSEPGGRVDIVLDNAGFELYTDLVFALFLLDSGLAETIVLHPKSIPWFVSDVLPQDILFIFQSLSDPDYFPSLLAKRDHLDYMVEKLVGYHGEGKLIIRTSSFWTTSAYFWEINPSGTHGGSAVCRDLQEAKLTILKGDLNGRKLLGDLRWPRTTKFVDAIGPLASSGVRILSLRTIKADAVVGLPEGTEEVLNTEQTANAKEGSVGYGIPGAWAWNGKYAAILFSEGDADGK